MPIKKARKLLLHYPSQALVSPTRIISNSSTPIEIYNKCIYKIDVETGYLLSASIKFTRFVKQIIKNAISNKEKAHLPKEVRHKYSYTFHYTVLFMRNNLRSGYKLS